MRRLSRIRHAEPGRYFDGVKSCAGSGRLNRLVAVKVTGPGPGLPGWNNDIPVLVAQIRPNEWLRRCSGMRSVMRTTEAWTDSGRHPDPCLNLQHCCINVPGLRLHTGPAAYALQATGAPASIADCTQFRSAVLICCVQFSELHPSDYFMTETH